MIKCSCPAISPECLPVSGHADVIVCGGGTSGVFAALAAADQGADVLLLESSGSLGGTAAGGLVTPFMTVRIDREPRCSYLDSHLTHALCQTGGSDPSGRFFDPFILSAVLEQMCRERQVRLLYYTQVTAVLLSSGQLEGVVIANKSGLSGLYGKCFVDCTGDGDIAAFCGCGYDKGHPETGKNQPMSLRYMAGGIDHKAYGRFLQKQQEATGLGEVSYDPETGKTYAAVTERTPGALGPVFRRAIENGHLAENDAAYWQTFSMYGHPDYIAFNHPEFFEHTDGTSPEDLTLTQIKGKQAILRQMRFYQNYFPGFEHAYLTSIASMVGVRESRRIHTDFILTGEDMHRQRKFDDCISQCNYPVDIHGPRLSLRGHGNGDPAYPWYEVPFRCLAVTGIRNLLTAGRCIGADFAAQSSLRIQVVCRSTGEAAGIAAAQAASGEGDIHLISGSDIRQEMIRLGAVFLPVGARPD